jgi:hypothetical protein
MNGYDLCLIVLVDATRLACISSNKEVFKCPGEKKGRDLFHSPKPVRVAGSLPTG